MLWQHGAPVLHILLLQRGVHIFLLHWHSDLRLCSLALVYNSSLEKWKGNRLLLPCVLRYSSFHFLLWKRGICCQIFCPRIIPVLVTPEEQCLLQDIQTHLNYCHLNCCKQLKEKEITMFCTLVSYKWSNSKMLNSKSKYSSMNNCFKCCICTDLICMWRIWGKSWQI